MYGYACVFPLDSNENATHSLATFCEHVSLSYKISAAHLVREFVRTSLLE